MPIYLDNAATTPLDKEVLDTMLPYMTSKFGNPSSIHGLGRQSRAAIERVRKEIAKFLNASVGEIFFTSGGTESNNLALWGAVKDLDIRYLISSPIEHHCVLHTLAILQRLFNIKVDFVQHLPNGHVDLAHLEQLLKNAPSQALVSLMHVNNEIGNVLDLMAVSKLCQQYNALQHTDAVQSFCFYPLDVQACPIHFLTGSAHKFHGPKGVGFIYINNDHKISALMQGGSQERNMRSGTENLYGIVGMGKAVEIAKVNMATHHEQIQTLRNYMLEQLLIAIPDISFLGDPLGNGHYKILNVTFPPSPYTDLMLLNLDISGICASGGSACSSGVDAGSHVVSHLKQNETVTNIRFSLSKFNTKEEIDTLITTLKKILHL